MGSRARAWSIAALSVLCTLLSWVLLRTPPTPAPGTPTREAPAPATPSEPQDWSSYRGWPLFQGWPLPQVPVPSTEPEPAPEKP